MKYKIIAVVFLILGIVVVCKWKIWFGDIVESKFDTPPYSINRVMLSLGEKVETERNLAWQSDTVVRGNWVLLVKEGTADTVKIEGIGTEIKSQGGKSVFYRAEIKDLSPYSNYFYQIKNDKFATSWYSFKMGNDSDGFSFIYMGDVQNRKLEESGGVFQQIASKYSDIDFWAFGGDMIERPIEKYWNIWYESLDQVPCSIPVIACPGNHEYFKGIIKKIDKRWTHYFPLPHNGSKNYKGRCCYWEYKNSLIVTLDTDGFCNPLSLKEQYDWLKDILTRSKATWKIVIMHHPVNSLRKACINIGPHYFLKPLFEECGVDLVLQGHDHGYARMDSKSESGNEKTPVYVISSCSQKFYRPSVFDTWNRMAAYRKMYQVISVSKYALSFKCYDVEKGLYDDITIHSKDKSITENNEGIPELLEPSEHLQTKGGDDLKDFQKGVSLRKKRM